MTGLNDLSVGLEAEFFILATIKFVINN